MLLKRLNQFVLPRCLWLSLALLWVVNPAHAHSPFDNSVRAILTESELEVSVTLGADAATRFLQHAAPGPDVALGGMGPKQLPTPLAGALAEVKSGDDTLTATSLQVMGDGLEYTFVAHYPRPTAGTLSFRANYFAVAPEAMKLGTLVVADTMGRQLGSGLISRESTLIELSLPGIETTPVPSAGADAQVEASRPEVAMVARPAPSSVSFAQFLRLGIAHILTGFDHLLFLCALLVACDRIKPMLTIITCFTLAHSVTLALAALDFVSISPRLVEPLIAASIVYVGLENFRGKIDLRKRCLVTLSFGLIHGFGFAGVLRESGLAERGAALAKPLLAFNLGVELGQLAVAAVFLPLLFLARRTPKFERYGTAAVSACVVALGGFWLVERLIG